MRTMLTSQKRWLATVAVLAFTFALAAPAQADPAGRIGRIAWLSGNGTVQLDNKSTGESFSAPLNQPLTSGDILTTGPNTRTEIQIGSMTLRLDGGSRLELDTINDEQVAVFLAEGRAIAKLSSAESLREFTLETRNGRFSPRETGVYRFDAEAGTTSATAYIGSLRMEGADSTLDIRSGERLQLRDGGQTPYRLSNAPNDSFSQWSYARDQRPAAKNYARYVSPEMTGAEDLDAHGNWAESPEYGAIWTPRNVASDWAPYQTGHWAWVAPWGWSWVGNEPWGFAPFHYGRWVQHHGHWGWVPGVRVARPVYAPAMVAWVGTPSFGISISIGSAPRVGWFPLGPREVFVPSYRCGTNYVRNVNVTHVTNITNINNIVNEPHTVVQQTRYMHRDKPHAMTVVPADVVTHRRPVGPANIAYREHRGLRDQPIQAGAPVTAPRNEGRGDQRANQERREERREERRDERGKLPAERERPQPNTTASVPEQATPGGRNERTQRDAGNRFEPNRQPEQRNPVIASQPGTQANGTVATTRQPEQREPVGRDGGRREREREQGTPAPTTVSSRDAGRPVIASSPQTPDQTTRRNERPALDTTPPVPSPRIESTEPRIHERQSRRDDDTRTRPNREIRIKQTPQPVVVSTQRAERRAIEASRPTPAEVRVPDRMPERMPERSPERPQREARIEPTPQPVVVPTQRAERPAIEISRPTPVEVRVPDRMPQRSHERPQHRAEPIAMPQQREVRSEPVQQQRQAAFSPPARVEAPSPVMRETRHEAPREISRAPEQRVETKPQRHEERQRSAQNEKPQEKHKRDEGDKR